MTSLTPTLRKQLENAVREARILADKAAADAIERLGIAAAEAPAYLSDGQKALRRRLRAHARALGDRRNSDGRMTTTHLAEAAAYEHWHRMLFGRFLVERGLLIHPDLGVAISRGELRELAEEDGFPDEWALVERCAAPSLPAVFKPDDPVLSLELDPHFQARLRALVTALPEEIFLADDAAGWTYQFWRTAEKKAVNDSQVKIGAAELPAVTQLFTEPYMVKFLLHNTLGAWWAGKVLAAKPDPGSLPGAGLAREAVDETALRAACALSGYEWEYLRFVREDGVWRPAAGIFPGWPQRAAEITVLDPCCGSGHFLTEALAALAALRGAEEGLPPADAVAAVLRDNLAGLEIDGRCVQIAAFALALAAWRIAGAQTRLPVPHVAWVGAPPPLPKAEFAALANGDAELRQGLETLHDLFAQAPLLGSLIEVTGGDLASPTRIAHIEESIAALVERMRGAEPERAEGALAARGMADAAAILARRWVLQATNVPFLGRGRQEATLADYLAARFASAKTDLATAMLQRMRALGAPSGTVAAVTPQNWLFLRSYRRLREEILTQASLAFVAALGAHSFETVSGEVVNVALVAVSAARPFQGSTFVGLNAHEEADSSAKAQSIREASPNILLQRQLLRDTQATIGIDENRPDGEPLKNYTSVLVGTTTGDAPRFIRKFWEWSKKAHDWEYFQTTVQQTHLPIQIGQVL